MRKICSQGIKQVESLKRTSAFTERLKDLELRIGSFDETTLGPAQFAKNRLVGFYHGGNQEPRAIFVLSKMASGRYLTIQTVSLALLEINEVNVYGEK